MLTKEQDIENHWRSGRPKLGLLTDKAQLSLIRQLKRLVWHRCRNLLADIICTHWIQHWWNGQNITDLVADKNSMVWSMVFIYKKNLRKYRRIFSWSSRSSRLIVVALSRAAWVVSRENSQKSSWSTCGSVLASVDFWVYRRRSEIHNQTAEQKMSGCLV